jgi:hypothetical protein
VPPLIPRSKRLRTALFAGISIVLVVAVALLLASTADTGGKQTAKAKAKAKAKARAAAVRPVKLVLGAVVVQSTGLPGAVRAPVRAAVMRATQQYFDDAILAPVRRGRVDNRYARVFDPGVQGLAKGKHRGVLTEAATRDVIRPPVGIKATKVRIDAVSEPTGKLALVATTFILKIDAQTPTGRRLVVRRRTELTFADEFGKWVVTAYRVSVRRSVGGRTTTTTAHSPSGASA